MSFLESAEETVESEHVHAVYSRIASHFSDTRYKPWPKVAEFIQRLQPGSLVADVGCGNGKYLSVSHGGYTIGCDICPELVSIAGSRGHQVTIADTLNLPFRRNSFDAVISIAVIHHLSSQPRRQQAVRELLRVVREGGKILVYVWAMEQERKKFTEPDVLVPWHLQPRYVTQSAGAEAVVGKKKSNKKQRSRKRREMREREQDEGEGKEEGEGEGEGEEGCHEKSLSKEQDSCEIGKDEQASHVTMKGDHMMPGLGHVTTKGDHMTPSLEVQGFQTFLRYYHVFQKHELSRLFNEVGGVRVLEEFYDHENWCVVAEKTT